MKMAVNVEKRLAKGKVSNALRDVLTRCVGEYNRLVTKKAHRIDTPIKNLILNLFSGFASASFSKPVHGHFLWDIHMDWYIKMLKLVFEVTHRWWHPADPSPSLWHVSPRSFRLAVGENGYGKGQAVSKPCRSSRKPCQPCRSMSSNKTSGFLAAQGGLILHDMLESRCSGRSFHPPWTLASYGWCVPLRTNIVSK